jgi:hypothetical protein
LLSHRALFLLPLAALLFAAAATALELPARLAARRLVVAESLPDGATLGRIRLLGMLALPTLEIGSARLAELSALAWDDDDGVLYALSDKGWLFHLKPELERDNILSGITLLSAVPLFDPRRGRPMRSWLADAEGMDIVNGRNRRRGDAELVISFEHTPRIYRYRPDGSTIGAHTLPPALAEAKAYRGLNKMLEAVCVDARLGVLTTPEQPLVDDNDDTTRLFDLTGKSWRYPVTGDYRITALECLGDGRLLVLERDFGILSNAASLKLVTLPPQPGNATLVPLPVATLDAAEGHQTDNFEGLTRHQGNRFFMISDDNNNFVQRTLLLYFELLPTPVTPAHR